MMDLDELKERILRQELELGQREQRSQCSACGGSLIPLGDLGSYAWARCRACGLDQISGTRSTDKESESNDF